MVLVCWVFEGVAHRRDVITHAARYDVWSYGFDEQREAIRLRYELVDFHPIQLTIQRIRKHKDWSEMPAGYSGLFNFAAPNAADWALMANIEPPKRTERRPTLENPARYSRLCLFDSEASAHAYTEKVLKEHNFAPF